MECNEKEAFVSLFEYYQLQMGFKPSDGVAAGFKQIAINSPKGKLCKKTIDATVALMESMDTQEYDAVLAELVLNYLSVFAFTKSKELKK